MAGTQGTTVNAIAFTVFERFHWFTAAPRALIDNEVVLLVTSFYEILKCHGFSRLKDSLDLLHQQLIMDGDDPPRSWTSKFLTTTRNPCD
jgi:hypothetical protein